MKKVALSIAALLVLVVVSPAFSQPFADVPTDHWAFDAIAELAAKGLVEGYPDGTFKGDRAMTRYEMAMVVARILARVEAIKIPPPPPPVKIPPPEVTRADIQTLQRLINEFRAELAALGVRVTAVEEELAAVRAKLDNVKVTGNSRFRYTATGDGSAPSVGLRTRFQFAGSVSPALTAVVRYRANFSFGTPASVDGTAGFDLAYLDAKFFGASHRLGRQTFALGSNGLLFDAGETSQGYVDGLKIDWPVGPLTLTGALLRDSASRDLWMVSAAFNLIPGWTTAVQYYNERAVPTGTSNTGFGVNVGGDIVPGVSFAVDYATFTVSGGSSQSAYKAGLTFDLGRLSGMTAMAPTLQIFYKNYGPDSGASSAPAYSNAEVDNVLDYTWNFKAWGAILDLTLNPSWSLNLEYEAGNCKVAGGFAGDCPSANASFTEYYAMLRYALAKGATLDFIYWNGSGASANNATYRLELNYSW